MKTRTPALILANLDARDLLELVAEVCRARGVLLHELCGRSRSQSISHARHEAWWLLHHQPDRHYSLSEIARLFDRDPSTVLAGVAAHDRRRPPSPGHEPQLASMQNKPEAAP